MPFPEFANLGAAFYIYTGKVKDMGIVKLSVAERRRLSAFITCILIATGAWMLATLSGTYNFTIRQTLTFKNAPQKRAYHALQPDTVDAVIQGDGWHMLFARFNNIYEPVTIDLHTLEHSNFIALNTQISEVNRHRDKLHRIISFNPDTLYFDFTNRVVKKIIVEPLVNVTYWPQFAPSGKMTVKPAYVTINGPANVVNKITSWKTDTLKVIGANNDIRGKLTLQPVKEGNINIYPKSVQVHQPIEEFTEKTLRIPVNLIGNPHYYNVKIFPQYVKVTFTIPLSRYAEVDQEFFEANANFALWEQGYTVLPVNIIRMPAYCRIVNVVPRDIDFLIKK
jgi:YbbR domain-containing protein